MNAHTKWALLTLVSIFNSFAGRILAPVVALFASKTGWLPAYLSWFQTPDNSLDGDGGWQTEHMQWRFKLSPAWAKYLGRVGWLWRNNMYGFSIDVLGAKVKATDVVTIAGDLLTSDNPAHSGWVRREIHRDGVLTYWQWYFVQVYFGRCLRMNFGWKLWGCDGTDKNIQHVLYINPLKTARGTK